MATLLLEELLDAESVWREVTSSEHPLFADMPVEHVEPDPKKKRHWFFATDAQKIMAHVYKPDFVLQKFREVVVPLFGSLYDIDPATNTAEESDEFAHYLIECTFTYLLFHELIHPVYCPRSQTDKERLDVALKNGIKRAEPTLSPRDLVNKVGNARNFMWDFLDDIIFTYSSNNGSSHATSLSKAISRTNKPPACTEDKLPDGIVTTWDVVELSCGGPQTLFYPITRAMYALLHCGNAELRNSVFSYVRGKMGTTISDGNLENVVVASLQGTVKYLSDVELARIGIDRSKYLESVAMLYTCRADQQGTEARTFVVRAIAEINLRAELRYKSIEGIIEPLAKYISTTKEERRDGANMEGEGGQGNEQTSPSEPGGGAEEVLQNLINQNDPDVNNMLSSIANDQSAPQTPRNQRLSNLAKDEYYKRNARELAIKSPTVEATTREVGKVRTPVKVSERLLTLEELHDLPIDDIVKFQQETGLICLMRLSQYQWRYDIYEWQEQPIVDFEYKKTGIILPDNIIFRVDSSGSMTQTKEFVGTQNRYDCLMHVIYGITKSAAKAAKEMNKPVQVVVVNYSNNGQTKVSEAVELQTFLDMPNNAAKEVLLNPQCGQTYHDIAAYQEAYARLRPGKTIEIVVTDGDLQTDQDLSMTEVRRILGIPTNIMVYVPIFEEGGFAKRMSRLAPTAPNLTYVPMPSFSKLQSIANDIIVQYSS